MIISAEVIYTPPRFIPEIWETNIVLKNPSGRTSPWFEGRWNLRQDVIEYVKQLGGDLDYAPRTDITELRLKGLNRDAVNDFLVWFTLTYG